MRATRLAAVRRVSDLEFKYVYTRERVASVCNICMHAALSRTHTRVHTYTYTHAHIRTYTHTHIHTYTHTHMHTCTHTHIHTYTHTHVHTYAHIHTTHIHTHTHTHTEESRGSGPASTEDNCNQARSVRDLHKRGHSQTWCQFERGCGCGVWVWVWVWVWIWLWCMFT